MWSYNAWSTYPRRAYGEVAVVERHRLLALAGDLDREPVRLTHRDLVEQRDGVEHGDEVVVAVRSQRADRELQVDLRGHPHRDTLTHDHWSLPAARDALACAIRANSV